MEPQDEGEGMDPFSSPRDAQQASPGVEGSAEQPAPATPGEAQSSTPEYIHDRTGQEVRVDETSLEPAYDDPAEEQLAPETLRTVPYASWQPCRVRKTLAPGSAA